MQEVPVRKRGTVRSRSALHTLVLDSVSDQVAIIDRSGAIVDLNAAWLRFVQLNRVPLEFTRPGSSYLDLVVASGLPGDSHVADAAEGIQRVLAGSRREFQFEYPMSSSGSARWVLMRVIPTAADSLFVVSHFDITERRRAEDEAWQLAHHDPLTGLPNRRHFDETLDTELRRSMRRRTPISLVEVDVDSFKAYNDTSGHVAGDRCLVHVAEVLARYARRPGDLAARLGGDEFALILAETDYEAAGRIAQGVRRSVESLGMSFGPAGKCITVSVGVATAEVPSAVALRGLFDAADRALYRAKSDGRNRAVHVRTDGSMGTGHGGGRLKASMAAVP